MKIKIKKIKKDENNYRQMKRKLFLSTMLLAVITAVILFILYKLFLDDKIAHWVVYSVLIDFFKISEGEALFIFQNNFRAHKDIIIFFTGIILFFILFKFYINRFTKYFNEVNRGIDSLINYDSSEITLSPELSSIEKKINTVHHTLIRQKLDAQTSEQRKNDLIMYLAHDLKTPLTSVIGYLTLLKDEEKISDELREKYLSISLEKAERLEELINEFFEITKFNLSEIKLEYKTIDLTRMLEQLIFEFEPILLNANLKSKLKAPDKLMLRCDPDKLQRVFDNLLRNASNYSYSNTTIGVLAEQKDNSVTVKFMNIGDNIPKEKLDRIFEQFYRLDSSRNTKTGGAGLGLAISKKIVELHGGSIKAHCKDNLTCFEVILPLS